MRERTDERTGLQSGTLALKVEYSPDLKPLRLKGRAERLIREMRDDIGHDFMTGTRVVVAHPVQRNLFMQLYRTNFLR